VSGLDAILDGRRVVICAGSGGVGKTTTAATIAVGIAAGGRRACVVTIDPARRLAASLGLDGLDNEPRRVDDRRFAACGVVLTGELWAMMLDPKATLDDLVGRLAPDPGARAEILANRIYRELSAAVAGTQEYTAMAKLYDLYESDRFDVIVLDTPPSRNALDFIDAPDRLTGFLEGRALRTLVAGSGMAARFVGRGTSAVLGVLGRVTGTDLLRDVGAFLRSLGALLDGFRARAREIKQLLADPATTFVLVSSPQPEPAAEAVFFAERLRDAGLHVGGLIVNAVHEPAGDVPEPDALAAMLGPPLAARVQRTCAEATSLAKRDADTIAELAVALDVPDPILVPHFATDVHDAAGLAAVHAHLFGPPGARTSISGGYTG
jgi:anion-transporting  ArsA/GET3 family ATPase